MRVLVTGHHGYIGAILAPMLVQAGHEVVGLDSDLYAACTYGEWQDTVPSIQKDIRDVELEDLKGFDCVMHLAGLSNDPLGDLNPELTGEINHQASVRLAKLAKQAGVRRFIFSSSCSNYGAAGDDMLDENSAFNPVTPYGKSKVMVEQDVSQMADDHFSPTFLRNATAYGVSPFLRFDLVLNNLVAWAFTTGKIYMKSDGSPWRPIVHIEDISRAFLAALHAPIEKIHNEAFNVGQTTENYRIRELAEIVAETVPGCEVSFAPDAGPDKRNYRVNCDKIQRVLPEFKPQWNARRGAQELYRTLTAVSGLKLEDFEGPRYKRIAHIKELISAGVLDQSLRWTKEPARPTANQTRIQQNQEGNRCSTIRLNSSAVRVKKVICRQSFHLAKPHSPIDWSMPTQLDQPELTAPLTLAFCPDCSLVQILETVKPEVLFGQRISLLLLGLSGAARSFAQKCT